MNLGVEDVSASITAAGTTQGTATELINGINVIGTAAAGTGVVLFAVPAGGGKQVVYNGGANAVKVYPQSGAQINALGTNNGMTLAPNTACEFFFASTTQVIGLLSA